MPPRTEGGGLSSIELQRLLERERELMRSTLRRTSGSGIMWHPSQTRSPSRPEPIFTDDEDTTPDELDVKDVVKNLLKQRNLNQEERRVYHKPDPDWIESPKGEVKRCSTTLEIGDILSKHKVV